MFDNLPPIRILHATIGLLVVYGVLSYWLLPVLRAKIVAGSSPKNLILWSGTYGFWTTIRGFAATGLIACLIVGLMICFFFVRSGGMELGDIQASKSFFESALERINVIRPIWWFLATIMLVIGMAILSRRQWKTGMERSISLEIDKRIKDLQNKSGSDFADLPPNEEMMKTLTAIHAADELLRELKSETSKTGELYKLMRQVEQKLGELTHLYRYQDVARRIDLNNLQIDELRVDEAKPASGFAGAISNFFTDRLTVKFVGFWSRVVVATSLVCALLSTIGLASQSLSNVATKEIERLSALEIAFNGAENAMTIAEEVSSEAQNAAHQSQEIAVELEAIETELSDLHSDIDEDDDPPDDVGTPYVRVRQQYRETRKEFDLLRNEIAALRSQPPEASQFGNDPPSDSGSQQFKNAKSAVDERILAVDEVAKERKQLSDRLTSAETLHREFAQYSESSKERVQAAKQRCEEFSASASDLEYKLASIDKRHDEFRQQLDTIEANAEKYKDSTLGKKSRKAANSLQSKINAESVTLSSAREVSAAAAESDISRRSQELLKTVLSRDAEIAELRRQAETFNKPDLTVNIERMQAENAFASSRFSQRLNPTADRSIVELAEKIAANVEHQASVDLSERLSNGAQDSIKRGNADAVRDNILKRHEQIKGGYVPDSYVSRHDIPGDYKTLIQLAGRQAKDGQPSVRTKMVQYLSEALSGVDATQRSRIAQQLAANPPPRTASMGQFVKTLLGVSFAEMGNTPGYGPAFQDLFTEVATRINMGDVEGVTGPNASREIFDAHARTISKVANEATAYKTIELARRYPPTLENALPTQVQAETIKQIYDPFLADMKERITKEMRAIPELDPSMLRQQQDLAMTELARRNTGAIEGFDQHFPGHDPPPSSAGPAISPGGPKGPDKSGGGNTGAAPHNNPRRSAGGRGALAQGFVDRYRGTPSTGGGGGSMRLASSASRSFGRSRSFTRLRGFRRVGGVLIGREPENTSRRLNLHGFRWQWNEGKSRLKLGVQDAVGTWHDSNWHDPKIVDLAMAYAADGRPITVTMTTAAPLTEFRIHLHPTLIDTKLGHSAIELDRFVDKHFGSTDLRNDANFYAMSTMQLFQYASAVRLRCFADLGFESLEAPLDGGGLLAMQRSFELASETIKAIELKTWDFDRLKRIVSRYEKAKQLFEMDLYFDKSLATVVEAGMKRSKDLSEFKSSVEEASNRLLQSKVHFKANWLKENPDILTRRLSYLESETARTFLSLTETYSNWFERTPTFEVWSGVREHPYELSLENILSATEKTDRVYFMLQVAFTSAPLMSAGLTEQEREIARRDEDYAELEQKLLVKAENSPPWEFPAISDDIQRTVETALSREANAMDKSVLDEMNAFVTLQRFFRCEFRRRLGDSFPLQDIVDLDEELADELEYEDYRTLRFNTGLPGSVVQSFSRSWSELKPQEADFHELDETERTELLERMKKLEENSEKVLQAASTLSSQEMPVETSAAWNEYVAGLEELEASLRKAAVALKPDGDSQALTQAARMLESTAFLLGLRRGLNVHLDEAIILRRATP